MAACNACKCAAMFSRSSLLLPVFLLTSHEEIIGVAEHLSVRLDGLVACVELVDEALIGSVWHAQLLVDRRKNTNGTLEKKKKK